VLHVPMARRDQSFTHCVRSKISEDSQSKACLYSDARPERLFAAAAVRCRDCHKTHVCTEAGRAPSRVTSAH
jgi:hypothetical protein